MVADIPAALLQSPSFQLEHLRRRTRDCVEEALSHEGITLREYWVLTCLVSSDVPTQATLCDALGIDASDMVRLIDSLEAKSWTTRERDPQDRRRQIVKATKAGKSAHPHLAEVVTKAEDAALDDSTAKQLKHLRKLAAAIITANED
ncbi:MULTISPECIES: MarR family winged helix-turn-helix transcriptional regulator [Corynebacterium]|uniref:MarR family transcriptional regulator n=3 Tax=Corynebacterium TaxID=1716 RepID=A0ABD0BHQ6_CORUL|nr:MULTISPECIES: MarR family transcriptional regulator [Corynebacterium]AEG82400.1 MarR-family transcription regulator [Corynebacterium ulcerans 809]AEG84736.1 MarR-family transcription regulator [Corynebacterium ulcerans BR-AD22]AIT89912.1 MarR family transcriptional regulator [Corynebacterium ulcerans]AIU31260.1 Multiple antibiotic resistance protein [Corynebacterium ulcerans]AIU33440.1 MarR family transcriptional regulator [Corynebacterium ramonii FRC0011]